MQLKFEMNSVGKEHPDYVYDRVTDFDGQKQPAAGWDSDTEEEKTPRPESQNETKGKQIRMLSKVFKPKSSFPSWPNG